MEGAYARIYFRFQVKLLLCKRGLRDAVKHTMSMDLAEKDAQDLKGEKGTRPEEAVNNGAKIRP